MILSTIITIESECKKLMTPIEQLLHIHAVELQGVQKKLYESIENPVEIIPTLGRHIFSAGGKKLRPLLTLASAKVFNDSISQETISLAAAVECIHTATLIHDDVLDESKLRRGVPTANSLWGNSCSILVGDFLFAKAFELMTSCHDIEILKMLSKTSSKICQGEVKQMIMTNDINALIDDYFDVVDLKTGALFESACVAGAMSAGASAEQVEAFKSYGINIGRAFQVVDDILDYVQHETTIGKNPGDDYKDGKITLPILLLIKEDPSYKDIFIDENKVHFKNLNEAMQEHNVFKSCQEYVHQFSKTAMDALNIFEETSLIKCLKDVTTYLEQRIC